MSFRDSTPSYFQHMDFLYTRVKNVPNWPIDGIMFKDLMPLMADPVAFRLTIDWMKKETEGTEVQDIVGLEARGFPYGAALAYALGVGFTTLRKPGKLPGEVHAEEYTLEYGKNRIEMQTQALTRGTKVVLVDDLLATGGTAAAAVDLVRRLEVDVVKFLFVMELPSLNGGTLLTDRGVPYSSLLNGEKDDE